MLSEADIGTAGTRIEFPLKLISQMNFKNLDKDKTIKLIVKHLADKFGADKFKIKDYWEGDLAAIGLSDVSEKYLIYISTYGKSRNNYFVALEELHTEGTDAPYKAIGDFDEVSLDRLEDLFLSHLRIEVLN
jgi:hypothetical protein